MSEHDPSALKEKVRHLPDKPGVYLMKDRLGRIIYVGKARSLKKRVSSYFQRGRARTVDQPKIRALIELIADFDTVWSGHVTHELRGRVVPFIGRAELLANKRASGRRKDLADVEALGEDPDA